MTWAVFWALLLTVTPLVGGSWQSVQRYANTAPTAPTRSSYNLHLPLTDQERAYLAGLPPLRIGMDPDWPPYAFLDANGKPDGISADYLNYIVQTLHIQVKRVDSKSWIDTLRLAEQGQIDILVAMSPGVRLSTPFLATQSYIDYPEVIVTREEDFRSIPNLQALDGLRVAMVQGSGVGAAPGLDTSVGFIRVPVNSAAEGLRAVADGKANAFIGNLGVVDRLIRRRYAGILTISGTTDYSQSLSFGVAQAYEPLQLLINRVLKAIPEEDRERIQNTWLSTTLQNGVSRQKLWEFLAPISIVILISMAILGIIIVYLRREIRRRQWSEQELRFQIGFQQSLMATAPMPVFVKDMDGRYMSVNPAFENIVGLKAESLIGKTAREVHPKHMAGNDQIEDITAQVLSSGESVHGELQYRSNSGETHDVMYWLQRVNEEGKRPRAMLGVLVDVSRLRAMEREQRNLRRQLVELTRVLPALLFQVRFVSSQGFVPVFVSEYAEKLLGVSQSELMTSPGRWFSSLPPATRSRLWRPLLRARRSGESTSQEFALKREEGQSLWMRLEVVCHESNNDGCMYTGYLSDITQLKLQTESLAKAMQEAEEASRVKDTFLATMSHEIRTPMSGIIGVLDLMNRSRLHADDRHLLDMSRGAARTLLRILNDILDFAKSQTAELPMDKAPFSLRAVIGEVMGLFTPEMQRKGLQFDVFVSTLVAESYIGDGQRFSQVLLNLVGNALKFTDNGVIGITVEALPIDAETSTQQLFITVRDTGIGISEADQERLFQPFMQVGSKSAGGTGLGLVICKRIIEAMGGSIHLDSQPGKGTSVEMSLALLVDPAAAAHRTDHQPPQSREETSAGETAAPYAPADDKATILLVEDQPLNREVLARQLQAIGVKSFDVAANGLEAWHAYDKHAYRLVITDCAMPIMDGETLIRRIRAKEAGSECQAYLVALTANAMEPQREACIAAGANEVLTKPVDLDQLRSLLHRMKNQGRITADIDAEPTRDAQKARKARRLPEGIPPEEWPRLRERIIGDIQRDMDAFRDALENGQERPAWQAVHRILGIGQWFKLSDIASAALMAQTALEKGQIHSVRIQPLEQAVAAFMDEV